MSLICEYLSILAGPSAALVVVLGLGLQRLARRRSGGDAKELHAIRVASWVSATGLVLAGWVCLALFFPVDMWIEVGWDHFLQAHTFKAYYQGRRPIGTMCLIALGLASASIACGGIGRRQRSMPRLTTAIALLGGALSAGSIYLFLWWSSVDLSQVPNGMP
jgi:hypothetical protein